MLDEWLAERLGNRKAKGLHRSLPEERDLIDFSSNDYLGLARSTELKNRIQEAMTSRPFKNGATGSRLLSGNSSLTTDLEQKLAWIFHSPAALLFNSGYAANLAVLSSVPQRGDTIIYDELAHASIKDGSRLSLAKTLSFRHNDLSDLERKITKSTGRVFVVLESVYSMDGDECPLEDCVRLSEKLGFYIILDEAHTTGSRGPLGAGLAVEIKVHKQIAIRIYTFGKAMGVCGACVAGSEALVDYLINFSRPFIYTTATSPYQITSIHCAFDVLAENIGLQETLRGKIDVFSKGIGGTANHSAVQTFIVPGNAPCRAVAQAVQAEGFDVRPILSPTVPEGKERLRICLHTFNTDDEVTALATLLKSLNARNV